MKKNSKNLFEQIDDFFSSPPSYNQKAWGLINDFYHLLLTHMEMEKISRADLARSLNKSRSSVSQMFNKTPNLTVRKMSEIAHAVGLEISICAKKQNVENQSKHINTDLYSFYIMRLEQERHAFSLEENQTTVKEYVEFSGYKFARVGEVNLLQ